MSSQIVGVNSYPIVNGSFDFKGLTIYGETSLQYYIIVYSQAIQNNEPIDLIFENEGIDENNLYFYSIPLNITICDPGFVYTPIFNSYK